jgi:methylthioribulose-1-phosphate dehydratase
MLAETTVKTSGLAQGLIELGRYAATRGWCPANGGNFSARLDQAHIAISASGAEKGHMSAEDILTVNLQGQVIGSTRKPSDETLLHTALYQLDPSIGAVLHVHSVANTVLSLELDELVIAGYEMLKGIKGQPTHETSICLPIFNNSQDMKILAEAVAEQWEDFKNRYGFLVRGHGCYVWGANLPEARKHLDAYEFLFACELERLKI